MNNATMTCVEAYRMLNLAIQRFNYTVKHVTPSTDLVGATKELLAIFKKTEVALEKNQ